ncbi:UDP-N-acetylmuramoyl-tripeptide--D-alanyl-D-alanine ligase [Desulfonispora thiosulfatigenes DSM 11270]|uniref:UDP-N-acetylmuramoyl-tripeptide--D-alanyl-D-alanine ligase n=1 Tax=Desulfonispora thiosulfatigenes DSM 11270 TaxID=656914 RepID=A0A1W1VSW6_DESTI|nr:UDP-N-acetylmuramoyl-tripeptide--D-alanyl-D-alanine ligase [Desulfonispora thiosulfatigenes]SMB96439.1 UDP-N-acetylmuramoyl-tripeptide--D-alanyl-D-alanine ligase [Desulfonispora thiosulfatigenes DSM 11270]
MLDISIHYLSKLLGVVYRGKPTVYAKRVAIDSRYVQEGDLFFALPGEKVDGHEYVDQAFEKGAVGAVVTDVKMVKNYEVQNLLITNDTLRGLQDLAKLIRQNSLIPVVAITGSVGKTTTKDILFSLLNKKYNTLKTKGNYNNEIGLPLTLCSLDKNTEAAVIEMGMRGLGQIDFLCNIASPTHAIITNIGKTHAEILGSQENIAKAKAEILKYLPEEGTVLLNLDDKDLLLPYLKECKAKINWFGSDASADYCLESIIDMDENKSIFKLRALDEIVEIELGIPGEHNIINAISAIGVARSLDFDWDSIKEGLKEIELSKMRLQIENSTKGSKIINDAYNANPASMNAALSFLGEFHNKRKVAVLGDMYELGQNEEQEHKLIGEIAQQKNIDKLIVIGKLAKHIGTGAEEAKMEPENIHYFNNNDDAISFLQEYTQKDDVVLVKGSRGMYMEKIVEELMR